MANEIPVFMTKVECPVCKTINEFETIRMGAYTESGRDTDFCPTGREWRNPRYQHINPLLYFMATCSSCFYTREFNKDFKEWKSDSAFRSYRQKAVREKHLNALASADGLIKPLGLSIDLQKAPQESAIAKLLLGILNEKMMERPNWLDLGRWYLRVAWLFRERTGGVATVLSKEDINSSRLQKMVESLQNSFGNCEEQIQQIIELVELQPAVGPTAEDPYRSALANWETNLGPMMSSVEKLLTWRDTAEPVAPASENEITVTNDEDSSFGVFLSSLQAKDKGIPLNEIDALRSALKYYHRAYETARDTSGGNQKIQLAYMIGELARRIGEFDRAQEFFNVAMRGGQEIIHANRGDESRSALARKIIEMARDQVKECRTDA